MKPKIACIAHKYQAHSDMTYFCVTQHLNMKPLLCNGWYDLKNLHILNENLVIFGFSNNNFDYPVFPFAKNIFFSGNTMLFYKSIINKNILISAKHICINDFNVPEIIDKSFQICLNRGYICVKNNRTDDNTEEDFSYMMDNYEAEEIQISKCY